MAFFSMALFGLALRPLFTSQYLIYDFVNIGWQWTVKLEYLSLFIIMIGLAWFADNLYPSRLIRFVALFITFIFSAATITTLLFPVKVFSYSVLGYFPPYSVCPVQEFCRNVEEKSN
jgi:hypothetical protein